MKTGGIMLNHPFISASLNIYEAITSYTIDTQLPLDGLVYSYRCVVGLNDCKINTGDCVKYKKKTMRYIYYSILARCYVVPKVYKVLYM